MIRWHFVLTRLLIVIAIVMLVPWGLGPIAGYLTVLGLENATGAKVEIAKTRVGLFPPRLQLVDVQIADPRDDKEMRDAIRADTIDLVIDGSALLRRRWVASNGRITGLEIGSRRETSGHLPQQPEQHQADSDEPSMLGQLLAGATDRLSDQAESVAENLETVRRSREIRSRWETEYDTLVVRARNLEKQIRQVRDQARGIENPLRDWPEFERTLARAREARNELMSVREAIDSLPERLQADLASLDEAKRIDMQKVDQFVPGDLANSGEFGVEMVAEAVREQLNQIRGYLDGGRTLANYTVVAPETVRSRGQDYDLVGDQRLPELMIRHCEVGGLMRSGGNTYAMTGIVENLTPTPELLEEPTRARLRLEGPEVVRVEYVRDRRDDADVDLLTIHWPQMDAKPLRLGNDDAGIQVAGGQRELWIQIRNEGDRLDGRLVSKQTGLRMRINVDPKYADSPAAISLSESLATVDRIEIDANFKGTWSDLDLDLNTNLGQIFRRATQDAINGQLLASKQKLAAKVDQAHLEQTLALREWLGSRQSEARSLLASADKSIEEMSQKVLNEVGDADAYLGKLRSAIQGRLK